MVTPKTEKQLELMRRSGKISAKALKMALEAAKPGVNLLEIEKVAWDTIIAEGGKISFITVDGYKWATCLTVNEQLVHGIPHDYVLKEGDLLSIDVGAVYEGWHTDTAWSIVIEGQRDKKRGDESKEKTNLEIPACRQARSHSVRNDKGEVQNDKSKVQNDKKGSQSDEKRGFLAVGEEALWRAVKKAVAGNYIGDISHEIQTVIEGAGYSVSKELIGHGVGIKVHEPPDVPGIGKSGTGLLLQEGMTIAIEAIYAKGDAKVYLEDDGWTYTTVDHSLGGLFEMSVIVGKEKCEVLTDWRKV